MFEPPKSTSRNPRATCQQKSSRWGQGFTASKSGVLDDVARRLLGGFGVFLCFGFFSVLGFWVFLCFGFWFFLCFVFWVF